jgi:hypothetical protein
MLSGRHTTRDVYDGTLARRRSARSMTAVVIYGKRVSAVVALRLPASARAWPSARAALLRVLRELAHRGSIAAVAGAVRLTPSAVSQQLSALEREPASSSSASWQRSQTNRTELTLAFAWQCKRVERSHRRSSRSSTSGV